MGSKDNSGSELGAPDLPSTVIVYGSGGFASTLIELFGACGVSVSTVFDHSRIGENIAGYLVENPDDFDFSGKTIVFAIHNYLADIRGIAKSLLGISEADIWLPPRVAVALKFRGHSLENYWLTSSTEIYDRLEDKLKPIKAHLSDKKSLSTLQSLFRYRISGLLEDLPVPEPLSEQYFSTDVRFIDSQSSNVTYLDLGAFDGDGLRKTVDLGIVPERYIALEPEPENYTKLVASSNKATFPVICLPLSASNKFGTEYFNSGADGSAANKGGSFPVTSVALDDLLHMENITHIKFDIEGAELAALEGAKNLLLRDRPRLALSVYHKPDDIWVLFDYVNNLGVFKHYFLRTYGHQTFDTILYCIP